MSTQPWASSSSSSAPACDDVAAVVPSPVAAVVPSPVADFISDAVPVAVAADVVDDVVDEVEADDVVEEDAHGCVDIGIQIKDGGASGRRRAEDWPPTRLPRALWAA